MKTYRGVIFDLDGTLLNTLEDLASAVNHTMRQYALEEKTIDEVRTFVGNGVKRLIELCVPLGENHAEFDAIVETFTTFYESNSNHKTKPYDHVIELLESLTHSNYHLAIVSNKIDPAVKDLNRQYFSKWIDIAIGETKGIKRKPAPDMVYACLEQMKLTPSEVVYIGDSEVDILTAKNAGIDCISVNWGFRDTKWLLDHGAQCVVSDVKALEKEILGEDKLEERGTMKNDKKALFQYVDCVQLYVPNLKEGIAYYCDGLGLKLIWKTDSAVGLGMHESITELVIQNERERLEVNVKVDSVLEALAEIKRYGGEVVHGPFEIQIGMAAVIKDPWNNQYVILDTTKGTFITDQNGEIIGQNEPS